MSRQIGALAAAALIVAGLSGCGRNGDGGESAPNPTTAEAKPAAEHHHSHAAPHGGELVCVGDHLAHLEWVVNSETGLLTLFVLDSGAEHGVRTSAAELKVRVTPPSKAGADGEFELALKPVANSLTGETAESTSQFAAESPRLRELRAFSGTLASITIKGATFTDIGFEYDGEHAGAGHE